MSTQERKVFLSEDWTVVVLGLAIIGLVVGGIKLPIASFAWADTVQLNEKVLSATNLGNMGLQFLFTLLVALLGAFVTGKSPVAALKTFPILYLITLVAAVIGGNAALGNFGLETVIFSLLLGLLISNFFKLPTWFTSALSTELYVKIGLVLLGTNIVFGDILKAGVMGIVQSLLVVLSVWYFAFWLCGKLKIDKDLSLMISSAVSICGVSAAIATSGAIKGDGKKLSYVISLVLVCAIPMLLGMPYLAKWMHLSPAVTGAWLGGTIDTTGAVVGSGSLVGEEALKIATIVKFSQNVLLGLAAFAISVYWTYFGKQAEGEDERKVSFKVIWERFPKFILGFVGASLLFSFVLTPETVQPIKGTIKAMQGMWFALAFTSIGLETRFSELFKQENKKPLFAFLIAQTFNILITLAIASVLFR
jgi:uncharacterized integral membrane protein (TIGR00698 family)